MSYTNWKKWLTGHKIIEARINGAGRFLLDSIIGVGPSGGDDSHLYLDPLGMLYCREFTGFVNGYYFEIPAQQLLQACDGINYVHVAYKELADPVKPGSVLSVDFNILCSSSASVPTGFTGSCVVGDGFYDAIAGRFLSLTPCFTGIRFSRGLEIPNESKFLGGVVLSSARISGPLSWENIPDGMHVLDMLMPGDMMPRYTIARTGGRFVHLFGQGGLTLPDLYFYRDDAGYFFVNRPINAGGLLIAGAVALDGSRNASLNSLSIGGASVIDALKNANFMSLKINGISLIDNSRNITTNVGTVDGRDVSADGSKLDTIETGADKTDEANVRAALATAAGDVSFNNKNITSVGNVDGRDVSADGANLDLHKHFYAFASGLAKVLANQTWESVNTNGWWLSSAAGSKCMAVVTVHLWRRTRPGG
jgi:hypothetical protein